MWVKGEGVWGVCEGVVKKGSAERREGCSEGRGGVCGVCEGVVKGEGGV